MAHVGIGQFRDKWPPKQIARALIRNQAINNAFYCNTIDLTEYSEYLDSIGITDPLHRFIMSRTHNRRVLRELEAKRVLDSQNALKSAINDLIK